MSDYISREQAIDVLKETGIIQDNDLGHLVVDEINRIPTLDEKEIIRKPFERVVKRICDVRNNTPSTDFKNGCNACLVEIHRDIDEIVKEECGISE